MIQQADVALRPQQAGKTTQCRLAAGTAARTHAALRFPHPALRCLSARTVVKRRLTLNGSRRRQIQSVFATAAAIEVNASGSDGRHAVPAASEVRVLQPDPSYTPPPPLPDAPSSATPLQVLRYLGRLAFSEPHLRTRLAAALVLLLASKAAGLAAPFYFKQAVDALSAGGAGSSAAMTAATTALLLAGGCRVVNGVAKELQGPLFAPVSQDAGRRVSYYTFAHVLGLDLQFHLNRKTGALSRMLERGARSIAMIFRAIVFTFVPTALELAAVCAILARAFHPRVSALVILTFAAYAAWTVTLTRVAAGIRRQVKDLDNEITGKAVDALLNFETVSLFGNGLLEVRQYDTSLTAYQRSVLRLDLAAAALNAGQAFILAAGMTGAMLAAATGPAVASASAAPAAAAAGTGVAAAATAAAAAVGSISAGDLVMIQGLLLQLWAPLQFLGWFYRELRQSLVDMEDLFALLRTPSALPPGHRQLPEQPLPSTDSNAACAAAAGGVPAPAGDVELEERRNSHAAASSSNSSSSSSGAASMNGAPTPASSSSSSSSSAGGSSGLRLELRDVKFSYSSSSSSTGFGSDGSGGKGEGMRRVLRGVSLSAEPGESIAVVGPSGSGKSTLLRLLVRLYDCDEGQVLLNGMDVRELAPDSLRAAVAVVPQDTVLFNDTILHNVAYGRPGATLAEVYAAAAAAKLDAAIARMPAGWDTVVGERGLKLSGGEKQRVAIARAFLRQPRLLICDEATSALDTATEQGIMGSLRELAAGRTSVFVAHRLSTVQGCDRIYVMSDGKVAEQGTHAGLMAVRGIYHDMWEMQRAQQVLEEHLHPTHQQQQQQQQPAEQQPEQEQQQAWQHGSRPGRVLSSSSSSEEDEVLLQKPPPNASSKQ